MLETQLLGMECLAGERRHRFPRSALEASDARLKARAVDRIAKDRMADMREVHAYLMRPPGFEGEAQQGHVARGARAGKDLHHFIMRDRCTPLFLAAHNRNLRAVATASREAHVNGAFGTRKFSPIEGQIATVQEAIAAVTFEL